MYQSVSRILVEKSTAKLVVVEAHIHMCRRFFINRHPSGFVNSSDMYEEKVLQREASR